MTHPQRSWPRRIVRALVALAALGAVALAVLLTSLWMERRTEVTLPAPTGLSAVGRAVLHWTDSVPDRLAPVAAKRELLVWIWYPAAAGSGTIDNYMPAQMRAAIGAPSGPMGLITRDSLKAHSHSVRDAAVSADAPSYPVVIMRGGASAAVVGYSTLAEDLASHGYVVVGFDAPYRTNVVVFPDGRVIGRAPENNPEVCAEKSLPLQDPCMSQLLAAWTGDISFVLDRLTMLNAADASGKFTGRLDMTRVGVFGHSLGGATALQFCHDDPRCKAGIDIDGQPFGNVVRTGLHQPFMFLLSDHSRETGPDSRQIEANIQSIYDRLPPDARQRVSIRGAFHFTFSDDGAVLKSDLLRWLLRAFGKLGIDARRQLAVTTYCVHSFFDAYLKGTGTPLNLASAKYPEVQIQ